LRKKPRLPLIAVTSIASMVSQQYSYPKLPTTYSVNKNHHMGLFPIINLFLFLYTISNILKNGFKRIGGNSIRESEPFKKVFYTHHMVMSVYTLC